MLMEELEKVGYQKCIRYTGMYTTININNVHCGSCRFFFFFFVGCLPPVRRAHECVVGFGCPCVDYLVCSVCSVCSLLQ